jgi:hypothetical protein
VTVGDASDVAGVAARPTRASVRPGRCCRSSSTVGPAADSTTSDISRTVLRSGTESGWFIDDLDGSDAVGTVTFSLDNRSYEIVLSDENTDELHETLAPFIEHGRKARAGILPVFK